MRVQVTTAAVLISCLPRALVAAEPTEEQKARLQGLYREAKSSQILKDYAKSNGYLQELLRLLPKPEGSPLDPTIARLHYELASNHAQLGNKAEAILNLSRAVDHGFWDHEYLSRDDSLRPLRGEKDFESVLEKARRALGEIAFGLEDITGKKLKKEDYAGKVLILDIWGTWCPPCRKGVADFAALQKKYGGEGLAVIGLVWEHQPPNDAVKARVARFLEEQGVTYPNVLAPPAVIQSVPRLLAFPTTIYVARDGRVADRVAGLEPYAAVERRVQKLLAEKSPAKEGAR